MTQNHKIIIIIPKIVSIAKEFYPVRILDPIEKEPIILKFFM